VLNKEKALHPPPASVGSFYFCPIQKQAFDGPKTKIPGAFAPGLFLCSGGRIRTSDLWVMSPTSYHCSTPQYIFKTSKSKNMSPTSYPDKSGLHPSVSRCKCSTFGEISKTIIHLLLMSGDIKKKL
jgi:hypothetical protein